MHNGRQIVACLVCLLTPLIRSTLAREDCPASVCPDVEDETSFYQRFLKTHVRSGESLKQDKSFFTEGSISGAEAHDKYQAFRQTADENDLEGTYEVSFMVKSAYSKFAQKIGTGMSAGWWILLFLCCCCLLWSRVNSHYCRLPVPKPGPDEETDR